MSVPSGAQTMTATDWPRSPAYCAAMVGSGTTLYARAPSRVQPASPRSSRDEGRRARRTEARRRAVDFLFIRRPSECSALVCSPPVDALQVDQDLPGPGEDAQEQQGHESVP